ncbi:MAG: hypothetical protein H5U00_03535 [Clostridia bacterium]|nr:hypothetical protein [Clostridia bacterium]
MLEANPQAAPIIKHHRSRLRMPEPVYGTSEAYGWRERMEDAGSVCAGPTAGRQA